MCLFGVLHRTACLHYSISAYRAFADLAERRRAVHQNYHIVIITIAVPPSVMPPWLFLSEMGPHLLSSGVGGSLVIWGSGIVERLRSIERLIILRFIQ